MRRRHQHTPLTRSLYANVVIVQPRLQ